MSTESQLQPPSRILRRLFNPTCLLHLAHRARSGPVPTPSAQVVRADARARLKLLEQTTLRMARIRTGKSGKFKLLRVDARRALQELGYPTHPGSRLFASKRKGVCVLSRKTREWRAARAAAKKQKAAEAASA